MHSGPGQELGLGMHSLCYCHSATNSKATACIEYSLVLAVVLHCWLCLRKAATPNKVPAVICTDGLEAMMLCSE